MTWKSAINAKVSKKWFNLAKFTNQVRQFRTSSRKLFHLKYRNNLHSLFETKTLAALTAAAATALLATPDTLAATAATAAAATAATASLDAIEETAAAAAAADSVNELVEGTDTPVCAILEFDVEAAPLKTNI
uniref:Uncharacterized protein n=1 Tax=Glossina pallidipes TaxID=7398 RepID=A0A1B0A7T4_GLOPL